jgi:hypothetical protein
VLVSVTGGMRTAEVPADRINLSFVLGNRAMIGSVNAAREHFESGVRDLLHAESEYPEWLSRLFTHRVAGLERHEELFEALEHGRGVIKVLCDVAADRPLAEPSGGRYGAAEQVATAG